MGYRKQIGWITKEQYEALEVMPAIDLLENYKSAQAIMLKIKFPQKTFFSGEF